MTATTKPSSPRTLSTTPAIAIPRLGQDRPGQERPVSLGSEMISMAIESPLNNGVRRTWRSIEDADIV